MNIVITGGRGFIGTNLVKKALGTGHRVAVLDANLIGANPPFCVVTTEDFEKNYFSYYCNINNAEVMTMTMDRVYRDLGPVDCVIHLAAETHVDRSILSSRPFVETNVCGTHVILEEVMKRQIPRMVHMSTDEVYGSLKDTQQPSTPENTPFHTSSPYSASKAGGELLALSYFITYKLPVMIARPSNNFGPYQYHEKLIPLMIKNALNDKPLPVYGAGQNIRDWLYVEDCARALLMIAEKGRPGEAYNIGTGGLNERPNIDVVKALLDQLKKPHSLISYVEDRKGHDFRYSVCIKKIVEEIGWTPEVSFEEGLKKTTDYYVSEYQKEKRASSRLRK